MRSLVVFATIRTFASSNDKKDEVTAKESWSI
jgi:hypothetical protein